LERQTKTRETAEAVYKARSQGRVKHWVDKRLLCEEAINGQRGGLWVFWVDIAGTAFSGEQSGSLLS